jgi:glycopeptide antibiotics resistance protein
MSVPAAHPVPAAEDAVRPVDRTARALGLALFGYLALMVAVITLVPFRFVSPPVRGWIAWWRWSDGIMNIAMFVPLGFALQFARPRGARTAYGTALGASLLFSFALECVQLWLPDRFSSPFDVATNTVGGVLGAWLATRILKRVDGARTVQAFALELPLMGIAWLLVPLAWLVGLGSTGGARRFLVLPLVAMAGLIMTSVHAAYLAPRAGTPRWKLLAGALLWLALVLGPGELHRADDMLAALGVLVGAIVFRWSAPAALVMERVDGRRDARRFEQPTLRLALPLFAAYLALSTLWPLFRTPGAWHGMLALMAPHVPLTKPFVYRVIEHVAAFSLLGYLVAQYQGRRRETWGEVAPQVLGWAAGLSFVFEVARGWSPWAGASLIMWGLTLASAAFGGWLYLLQLAHIRALLGRDRFRTPVRAVTPRQVAVPP